MPFCFETVAMQHCLVYFHRWIFKVSRTSIPLKTRWRTCIMEVPFLPKTEPPLNEQNLHSPKVFAQRYVVAFFQLALCDRSLHVSVRRGQSRVDYKHRSMIIKYRAAAKKYVDNLTEWDTKIEYNGNKQHHAININVTPHNLSK